MPSHANQRNAIRSTWLNSTYWNFDPNIEIHHIFLLGVEDGVTVSESEHQYQDILQTDFMESHYNLSIKDYNFFKFIDHHCSNTDFVFKGDDDILLVPENAMYNMDTIRPSVAHNFSMTGCLKKAEPVNRKIKSKYYTPTDILADDHLPSYFSGAGYFMSKSALSKILPIRNAVPILPLDDVYVGLLIQAAGLSSQMRQSISICTGVHAFENSVYTRESNVGWGLTDIPKNPCAIAGLTIFHRFDDSSQMESAFKKLNECKSSKLCTEASITKYEARWRKKPLHYFIGDEFKIMCNNFVNPVLYSRILPDTSN